MLCVVLAVAALAGTVAVVRYRNADGTPRRSAAAACAATATLHLTAAPDIAPLLSLAAATLTTPGRCGPVAVTARQPADTLRTVDSAPPDAWVPSSSVWLLLAAGEGKYAASGTSLARSPLVVAAPRAYAHSLGWPAHQPGWTDLAARTYSGEIPHFSVPDPLHDTDGLLTVLGVRTAIAATTTDAGIAEMRMLTFRSRLADPAADPAALLSRATSAADPLHAVGLFPITEQALWSHLASAPSTDLVALYPGDGLMEADYPLALSPAAAADGRRTALANQLVAWLRSEAGVRALVAHGFRPSAEASSTAVPSADGILPGYPAPAQPPAAADITAAAVAWSQYHQLAFQVLLLVDGSGSMNDPVRGRDGTLTTKAELLRRSGVQAAQLFGSETSVGMWMFGTPTATSPPYVEVVPFGALSDLIAGTTHRDVLSKAAASYRPNPVAGTPLYESVLRGVAAMRPRVRPDALTLVVVLTDGRDEDSPYAMTKQAFLTKLAAARDPKAPVPVFCIGYGANADMGALTTISAQTGGQAVASNDPGDLASAIAKIFLAAHQPGR